MPTIQGVYAKEILDSRGIPTVECMMWLDTGAIVTASVPTGTSKGKYEALEIRDNDPARMLGQGVWTAVNTINNILAPLVIGKDPTQQAEIDQILITTDGTPNKSKLGANAVLAVSLAVLKAGAAATGLPLYQYVAQSFQLTQSPVIPTCIYTLINGGKHGADNLDIQEFQVIPASYMDYPSSLNLGVTLYHKLEEVLVSKNAIHSIGLVGGFTPNLYNNIDAFELLIETTKASPYTFAQDIFFGVDMAADTFYVDGKYVLKDKTQPYSPEELFEFYAKLRNLYQVFYLEDPYQDDDWNNWKHLTAELGSTTSIVGDSLLATNKHRVEKAIAERACNAISVKPNEIGTISETVDVVKLCKGAGWQVIMSHRSGETNDDSIADLAVGLGSDYCKFGPPNRGERIAKYNRLSQIFAELSQVPAAPADAKTVSQA